MSQISFTPPILPAQVQTREDLGAPKASNEHEPLGLTDKYINKGERNVHIWNHPLTTLLQCKRNQIYLVGGFFNHGDRVSYKTLYEWIDHLVEPPQDGDSTRQWLLLQWGSRNNESPQKVTQDWDPRVAAHTFPDALYGNSSYWPAYLDQLEIALNDMVIPRDSQDPCRAGNYMLVVGCWFKRPTTYKLPTADGFDLFIRTGLRSAARYNLTNLEFPMKDKISVRGAAIRKQVRARDGYCLVSGQEPTTRKRGMDYTALEVAHIFPISYAGRDLVIDAYQNAKELEITINLVKDPKNADKQWNAILLRSDIHKFFDTFQWGVWENNIYTIERTMPASLLPAQLQLRPPMNPQLVDEAETADWQSAQKGALQFHFINALSIYFVGLGPQRNPHL